MGGCENRISWVGRIAGLIASSRRYVWHLNDHSYVNSHGYSISHRRYLYLGPLLILQAIAPSLCYQARSEGTFYTSSDA